jgi:hypothetical protein
MLNFRNYHLTEKTSKNLFSASQGDLDRLKVVGNSSKEGSFSMELHDERRAETFELDSLDFWKHLRQAKSLHGSVKTTHFEPSFDFFN